MHADGARSGEWRKFVYQNSTRAKESIEQIELGGSNTFNNGVRHRELVVWEDEQRTI